jgi:hypothetical protein
MTPLTFSSWLPAQRTGTGLRSGDQLPSNMLHPENQSMSRRAQEHTYSEIVCVCERAFQRSVRMESRHFRCGAERAFDSVGPAQGTYQLVWEPHGQSRSRAYDQSRALGQFVCERTERQAFRGESDVVFEERRSASFHLSRYSFSASDLLAQLRAEFLRPAHCGRSASRLVVHVRSGCAPFGFRHPRKDFNLSQHRLTKSCRSPQKSTPCCLGAAAARFSGCPREQGKKRRKIA